MSWVFLKKYFIAVVAFARVRTMPWPYHNSSENGKLSSRGVLMAGRKQGWASGRTQENVKRKKHTPAFIAHENRRVFPKEVKEGLIDGKAPHFTRIRLFFLFILGNDAPVICCAFTCMRPGHVGGGGVVTP